jgi:hypothetical protein
MRKPGVAILALREYRPGQTKVMGGAAPGDQEEADNGALIFCGHPGVTFTAYKV